MSSADIVEHTPHTEAIEAPAATAETALAAHDHADHDHAGHSHEGHDHAGHTHEHAPALNPEVSREIEVTIPADEVSTAFRGIVKRYTKQARLPGFRIGKVPPSVIRSRFNEQIRQDVVEAVLPAHFRTAIDQQGIKPVSQPQVTELLLEDGQPLTFKAVFEVLPEINIDGYQDIKVEKTETALTEEDFEAEMERVKDSRSTMEPVVEERPLVDGDWAQITFKGDVKPVEGEDAHPVDEPIEGQDVSIEVGGKNTLPAFNDALRGASVGQELKFEVSYPADFGEPRLANKTIAYDVEIKGIKTKTTPELTDEFAKELGEYETMEDFKTKLREHLTGDKKQRLEAETKDRLLNALAEKYQFPIPETLVQQQIDARLDRGLRALAQQGMTTEDMRKLDFARLRAAQRDAALGEVKGILLLDKIADAENVQVSDEELEQELQIISLQTQEPLETLRARLTQDGSITRIREQSRREKVGTLLYERLGA